MPTRAILLKCSLYSVIRAEIFSIDPELGQNARNPETGATYKIIIRLSRGKQGNPSACCNRIKVSCPVHLAFAQFNELYTYRSVYRIRRGTGNVALRGKTIVRESRGVTNLNKW